jgi:Immunoglobulin domain
VTRNVRFLYYYIFWYATSLQAMSTVRLLGNVYIMSPPRNTTAMEGSRVRLGCHADGYPDNITYRWYRNGVDVQTIAGLLKVRGHIHDDGSLNIDRVTKYDSGWYRCKPTNGVGSAAPEADAYLNITCEELYSTVVNVFVLLRSRKVVAET